MLLLRRLNPSAARPLRSDAPLIPVSARQQQQKQQQHHHHHLGPQTTRASRTFTTSRILRDDAAASANHYETLKVPYDASPAEIKKSFYTLSKTHHPDHNPTDPTASQKFHAIAEAYSILGTPAKRAAYDRTTASSSSSSSRSHSSSPARHGSYHSTGPAGGRPASGLSRRRTTFRGPPPSFYRSGGWGGEQSAKKRSEAADGDGTGAEPGRPGMGPGQDPYSHTRHADVRHFDRQAHTRTQQRQDVRRAQKIMGQHVGFGQQESFMGAFFIISGTLFLSVLIPFIAFSKPSPVQSKKKS